MSPLYTPPEVIDSAPEGECAWWVESRGARCQRTPDEGYRVCATHKAVWLRRAEKYRAEVAARAERNRPRDEARAAKRAERRARIDAELARLWGPTGGDPAAVNTPLRKRCMSEAQIIRANALLDERNRL